MRMSNPGWLQGRVVAIFKSVMGVVSDNVGLIATLYTIDYHIHVELETQCI